MPTHHQRSPAHHMNSCTTLTAALHLRLQFPFSFCLVLLCCLVVWFLTFCLLPGSFLCLAFWILFADRRPRLFTWLLSCLGLYMPVCHLLDPACVLTMSSNKSLHMDPHASVNCVILQSPLQSPLRSRSSQSPLQSPLRTRSSQSPLQSPLRSRSLQSPCWFRLAPQSPCWFRSALSSAP